MLPAVQANFPTANTGPDGQLCPAQATALVAGQSRHPVTEQTLSPGGAMDKPSTRA